MVAGWDKLVGLSSSVTKSVRAEKQLRSSEVASPLPSWFLEGSRTLLPQQVVPHCPQLYRTGQP